MTRFEPYVISRSFSEACAGVRGRSERGKLTEDSKEYVLSNFLPHELTAWNIQVHPFFSKKDSTPQGTFQWFSPLGPNRSCLHGINLHPKASHKVAAFDLDGTIINSALRGKVVDGKPVWEWWRSFVPDRLKSLVDEG
jgi:hypothetical protein